jgi:hypothetical protein
MQSSGIITSKETPLPYFNKSNDDEKTEAEVPSSL